MAQTVVTTGSTSATGVTLGTPIVLNPVARTTTVILSATTNSSTAGTVQIEMSVDDPTIPGGPTTTWALLSSASAITSSQVSITPLVYTVLSPIAQVRVNSTSGSTGTGPSVYTLKALQSVTA